MQTTPHKIELWMLFIGLVMVGFGLYYLGPSITSFAIKEFSYEDEISLVVTSSGNYSFELENAGELKSLKIDGKVTNYGKARVYIENNGAKYLIFDSAKLNDTKEIDEESKNLITAFAIKEEDKNESDKEKKKINNKPDWTGANEFVINSTTMIDLSQQFTDDDNDTLIYSVSEIEGIAVSIEDAIATLTPALDKNFNTTITFIASDGIDSKSKTVKLIVIVEKEEIIVNATELINESNETTIINQTNETLNITPINHAPKWVGVDSFVLNKTLAVDLSEYFVDEDNDALTFRVSDAVDIAGVIDGSILNLSASKENFNATMTITADDGNLSASKEIKLIVPLIQLQINEAKTITINLAYKTGTIYDANDNGEESINGIVDLGVEGTAFNWDVDVSRLCARWEVYNAEDETLTTLCNGNNDCCAFVGLLPSKSNWNDVYYSTFGKDGAGYNNIVSSQVLYYDVNLSMENLKSEIYYSDWGNLSVKFFEEEIKFFNACFDTCNLSGLNKSSYNLLFEIEDNAVLRIDKIKYSLLADVINSPPILLQNFSAIKVPKNSQALINLSQYFYDPDGDALIYDYYKPVGIAIFFDNNTATIIPEQDFEGITFTYITANDSDGYAISNVFAVNVSADLPALILDKIEFNFDDKESTNISYYVEAEGQQIKVPFREYVKDTKKFGLVFDEKEIKTELSKSGKTFDKKIYYKIETSADYEANGYQLERVIPNKIRNELGYITKRKIKFDDIFAKERNLFSETTTSANQSVCGLFNTTTETICEDAENGTIECFTETTQTNCLASHNEVVNATVKTPINISSNFMKKGRNWIIEFYNIFDLDPEFADTTEVNWSAGTFHKTNVSGSGSDANLTLNYTAINEAGCQECGNMSAGQRNYTLRGNFTSQVFDTGNTDSKFDTISYTIRVPNSSNVVGYASHWEDGGTGSHSGVFSRNGSIGFDPNSATFANDKDYTEGGLRAYTIPAGWSYNDIIGFGWDDDETETIFAFFRNGSVAIDTNQVSLATDVTFTDATSYFTVPQGINTSDIIGTAIATRVFAGQSAIFLKNKTFIAASDEAAPFIFEDFFTYTIAAGFEPEDALGVDWLNQSGDQPDVAMFFRNGSIAVDTTQGAGFTAAISFALLSSALYNKTNNRNSTENITTKTNITLYTRISNDSVTFSPWTSYEENDGEIGGNTEKTINTSQNVGRYIQYKAVFTSPDKYMTPVLEDVAIAYSLIENFTILTRAATRKTFSIDTGTFDKMLAQKSDLKVNLTSSGANVSGHYGSQVFDAGAVSNWTNISWSAGAPYGEELGQVYNDSNEGIMPFINTSGLVLYYRFNNDSAYDTNVSAYDYSVDFNSERAGEQHNNGTFTGNTHYNVTDKKFGEASIDIGNGKSDGVKVNHSPSLNTTSAFTVSAWINSRMADEKSGNTVYHNIVSKGYVPGGDDASWSLVWLGSTERIFFFVRHTASNYNSISFPWDNKNMWMHVVGTFDSRTRNFTLYQDGRFMTNDTLSTQFSFGSDANLTVGKALSGSGTLPAFNGTIDEVTVWNRSLSLEEIRNLYIRGAIELNLSARICNDDACAGETYAKISSNCTFGRVCNLNLSSTGRYFQYNFTYFNNATNITVTKPIIHNVSIEYFISSDINFTSLVNTTTRTEYGVNTGTFNNTFYNTTIGAIQLNDNVDNGTYQSQVFDLGTTQQFQNISWTQGAYYGAEIGRGTGDSNASPISNGNYPNISINTSGLVLLMHFNNESAFGENATEGSADRVYDFSVDVSGKTGGYNNGTTKGGATINKTNYILGSGAGQFDGVDDFVSITTSSVFGGGSETIAAWIYRKGDASAQEIFSDDSGDGNGVQVDFMVLGGASDLVRYSEDGVGFCTTSTGSVANLNQWYHVAVTSPGDNTCRMYVNGVEDSADALMLASDGDSNFGIGAGPPDGINPFKGNIDEIAVWNRVLSPAEILNLYKRGALKLNLSVRSCDDSACSGEGFEINATNSTSTSISNLTNNRFIQYQANFYTNASNLSFSPELYNVTIHYQAPADYNFTSLVNTTTRTEYGVNTGAFNNTFYNTTIGIIQLNDNVDNGTYQSQVFDLGTTQQFQNISWTQGAYYGSEIGRGTCDVSASVLPTGGGGGICVLPISNGIYPNISINTSGLVGLWYFNNESVYGENATGGDGDIVRDFSPDVNGERSGSVRNNGTTKNGATINKTNYKLGGGAGEFDGGNDYVDVGSPASLDDLSAVTVSAWIKPNSSGEQNLGMIVAKVVSSASVGRWAFFLDNTDIGNAQALRVFKDATTDLDRITAANGYSLGIWQHVVFTSNGSGLASGIHIYTNGVENSYSTSIDGVSLPSDASLPFIIGNSQDATFSFDGQIDEVSIWNRTLSSAEILNLYKRGAMRLNLSVRSCDDANCNGEGFEINATNSTKTNISNLTNNRFIQYQANFFTNASTLSFSPELYNVTIHYQAPAAPPPPDTCSCPASGDWIINCADNCVISSNCNMPNNDVHTYGTGTLTIRATINARNVFNRCNLFCYAGQCFT